MRDEIRDRQHVVCPHARREQRLMGIAECRIGQQQPFLRAGPLGELLRARVRSSNCLVPSGGGDGSCGGIGAGRRFFGFGLPANFLIAIDGDLAEVGEQLCRPVAPLRELEQLRRIVQESRRCFARLERFVIHDVFEERDVRLYAPDSKLAKARSMRWHACSKSRPHAVTFTSSES